MADKKEEKKNKSYKYRFIEMRDEMEKTVKSLENGIVQNAKVQMKLIEKGLDSDPDFKPILQNLKDIYKNYEDQLAGLKARIEIGNKFLEADDEKSDAVVTLLMDFLGVFKK